MTPAARANVLDFLAFQVGWFACVLAAAHGWPIVGPIVVVVLVVPRLLARPAGAELLLLAVAGGAGYVVDSAFALAGVMSFPEAARLGGPSPAWMVALWINFAATLRGCMAWLRGRPVLSAALGAAGGAIAYAGGAGLGALQLAGARLPALAVIALTWAAVTPALVALAARRPAGRRVAGATA